MVYLIHFDRPYKHARHYIGYTENLDHRIYEHEHTCNGARLLQVVREAGIGFHVVRVWEDGDRKLERQLKNLKKSSYLCPVCNELKGVKSEVKHGKKPTKKQKELIKFWRLNPENWLVVKDMADKLVICHRYTNHLREVPKKAG